MTTQAEFNRVRASLMTAVLDDLLSYATASHRPRWMSDGQWAQFIRWNRGEAIPTDREVIDALCMLDPESRGYQWVYGHVPGCLVGAENYERWCSFIDNALDVGL